MRLTAINTKKPAEKAGFFVFEIELYPKEDA